MAKLLKTDKQRRRELRDVEIYREWIEAIAVPGQSRTAVVEVLAKKYDISPMTVYNVIERVEGKTTVQ